MRHSLFEILLGGFVLITAIIIGTSFYNINNNSKQAYTKITANFFKADGINNGADVRLSGVKIGSVTNITLDPQSFQSILELNINENIKLPQNTIATIASEGILGKSFIRIEIPKNNNASLQTLPTLKNGDKILNTKDAIALEDLLGRALFIISNVKPSP